MKLPKELTEVTPLSKFLALSLFIILPIIAFFLGACYQQHQDFKNTQYYFNHSYTPSKPSRPNNNSIPYGCPKTEYIDCMPGPGKKDDRCLPDYLQWAQQNCQGFKGVAY